MAPMTSTRSGFHLLEESTWEETGVLPKIVLGADGIARAVERPCARPVLQPTPPMPDED